MRRSLPAVVGVSLLCISLATLVLSVWVALGGWSKGKG